MTYYTISVAEANYEVGQNILYNAFKAPTSISKINYPNQFGETLLDDSLISFAYNAFEQRSRMTYSSGSFKFYSNTQTRLYSADGSMEVTIKTSYKNSCIKCLPTQVVTTEFLTYLGGDAYTAPAVVKSDGTTFNTFYLHRDYQGSILAITNALGAVVEKRLFDPWGDVVKVQNGTGGNLAQLTFFERGYTGHEHLQTVGLINMNARLYDPKLHRFLSVDNVLQDQYNTQNYNRYGYCFNNPLKHTDVTGNIAQIVVAIAVGALISTFAYVAFSDGAITFKGALGAAITGAISGAVTFGIGEYAQTIGNLYMRAGYQALAHGTFQGLMSDGQGGNFWTGFASGALSSIASSAWQGGVSTTEYCDGVTGYTKHAGFGAMLGMNNSAGTLVFGAIMGGAGAALTGGNFWQGAVTGLVVAGLNHYAHEIINKFDISKRLIKLGYKPDDTAEIYESQLGDFAEDMFPNMMELCDSPYFKMVERIVYKDGTVAYGQTITYRNKEGGLSPSHIEISKTKALFSWKTLASTIGHELNHFYHFYTGKYDGWVKQLGGYSDKIAVKRASALSEYLSQKWELKAGGIPSMSVMNENYNIWKNGK